LRHLLLIRIELPFE